MPLIKRNAALKDGSDVPLVLALGAGPVSDEMLPAALALVRSILAGLPRCRPVSLRFLGDDSTYQTGWFNERGADWYRKNRRRASLLAPVIRSLPSGSSTCIRVLCPGPVFDAQDWEADPRVLPGELNLWPGGPTPTASEVLRKLDEPRGRVQIAGPGFMPLDWDNPSYVLRLDAGLAWLEGIGPVRLRFLRAAGGAVEYLAELRGGGHVTAPLDEVPEGPLSVCPACRLSAEEGAMFRLAAEGRPFDCVRCGARHPWDQHRCRRPDEIVEWPVYPSLKEVRGFLRFCDREDNGLVVAEACGRVVRISAEIVAIPAGQCDGVQIWQFDPTGMRWLPTERLWAQFTRVVIVSLTFDRAGFPMVELPELKAWIHLLPLAKVQFEPFLAEPGTFDDAWYATLLELNPRTAGRAFDAETRERLFLTGLLPAEVSAFAAWLGSGFAIPTINEWRVVDRAFARMEASPFLGAWSVNSPAREAVERLYELERPATLRELSLMRRGVVEWVCDGPDFAGLGAPRPGFFGNLWDPQSDLVRPVDPTRRIPFFGARLIYRAVGGAGVKAKTSSPG